MVSARSLNNGFSNYIFHGKEFKFFEDIHTHDQQGMDE
jgi:hypothetical protein